MIAVAACGYDFSDRQLATRLQHKMGYYQMSRFFRRFSKERPVRSSGTTSAEGKKFDLVATKHCSTMHGNLLFSAARPFTAFVENAIYVPHNLKASLGTWGIYDQSGDLIQASGNRRGPEDKLYDQRELCKIGEIHNFITDDNFVYIYAGMYCNHYGHFLLSSLARFWPLLKDLGKPVKLVFHNNVTYGPLMDIPIARAAMEAFGLSPDNIICPNEITSFRNLYVPAPSFIESSAIYNEHVDVCKVIGSHLTASTPLDNKSNPVYLSKFKLQSGISRLSNENLIMDFLERRSVDIVYPEQLTLAQQIRLFEERPVVVSYAGSAIHTALLSSKPSNIIAINQNDSINSSQILIDSAMQNRAFYVHAEVVASIPDDSFFTVEFNIQNPLGVAEDVMTMIDHMHSDALPPSTMPRRYPGVSSLWPWTN